MEKEYYKKVDKKAAFYPEDFLKILDLSTPKQKFTFLVLINTGARIEETRHIVKGDLDNERKNVNLRITKVRAKEGETRPDPRNLPVSSQFFKYFKKNMKIYKIMSTNQTGLLIKKYSKKVGVKNWKDFSAHNLRKTFGTWMLALNINGFKLAKHLGHSPNVLMKTYASPDIYNYRDKDMMRDILGDLPSRLRD